MLARLLIAVLLILAHVSTARGQLPPEAVILSKVKIPERQKSDDLCPVHLVPSDKQLPTWKYKGDEYRGHTPQCRDEFKKDADTYSAAARARRWENNFVSVMSIIWCPITDEVNAGGGVQWKRLGLQWESCCKFCDEDFAEEDFPLALEQLRKRAKLAYKATGGKYVEGAKSPVEGAIDKSTLELQTGPAGDDADPASAPPAPSPPQPTKAAASAAPTSAAANHREFIVGNCVACHNGKTQQAGVNFESIDLVDVRANAEVWEKVVHKIRAGDMPPPDRRQPSARSRRALVSWLVTSLDKAAADAPNPGRPAVHRLNRAEYANAVRDLLALEIDSRSLLPPDGKDFGFDNIADSLNVSPLLLERYMSAAAKISRLAIGDSDLRASSRIYKVPKRLLQGERAGEDLPFGSRGGLSVRHHFPLDGDYVIKVDIESPRSDQPRDLFQRSDAPEQLDVRVDGKRVGAFTVNKVKSGKWSYGKHRLEGGSKDDKVKTTWWGSRTLEVRFAAKAGTRTVATSFVKRTLAYEGVRPRHFPSFYDYLGLLKGVEPGVLELEIAGPYDATGVGKGSLSRQKIFTSYPTKAEDEIVSATEVLSNLARRAYRRPVTDRDMQTLLTFYAHGRKEGDFEDGIQLAMERILVSPSFLFRSVVDPRDVAPGAAYRLSDLELASRLSFFLWSSIPDDELLATAERGELKDAAVLERQVRRMLADPRSKALVTNFAGQWLHLRNLRAVKPDVNLFPEFDDNLREALRRETELFFASQLREDRSVVDLLSADYTFLNERLARHYEIPGIYGSHFRRVDLGDQRVGGLLGHGSILTVTSYATRTSPVIRGKWLLQNMLGSPPPPPPADVPELPESGEGGEAATLRERLELHVADPTCRSCHIKMDPLGLALENFDAIGKWRENYRDGLPVDSHGELPDGTALEGPAGLRDVMLEKDEEFVSTMIKKLLTYAVGRGVEFYDQPAVRHVAREAASNDYRWSSIVLGIVKSTPFQMRSSRR